MSIRRFALAALASALIAGPVIAAESLLNVSYDPTRELYVDFNKAFNKYWQEQGHEAVTVQQSHGGSGKQTSECPPAILLLFRASGGGRWSGRAHILRR